MKPYSIQHVVHADGGASAGQGLRCAGAALLASLITAFASFRQLDAILSAVLAFPGSDCPAGLVAALEQPAVLAAMRSSVSKAPAGLPARLCYVINDTLQDIQSQMTSPTAGFAVQCRLCAAVLEAVVVEVAQATSVAAALTATAETLGAALAALPSSGCPEPHQYFVPVLGVYAAASELHMQCAASRPELDQPFALLPPAEPRLPDMLVTPRKLLRKALSASVSSGHLSKATADMLQEAMRFGQAPCDGSPTEPLPVLQRAAVLATAWAILQSDGGRSLQTCASALLQAAALAHDRLLKAEHCCPMVVCSGAGHSVVESCGSATLLLATGLRAQLRTLGEVLAVVLVHTLEVPKEMARPSLGVLLPCLLSQLPTWAQYVSRSSLEMLLLALAQGATQSADSDRSTFPAECGAALTRRAFWACVPAAPPAWPAAITTALQQACMQLMVLLPRDAELDHNEASSAATLESLWRSNRAELSMSFAELASSQLSAVHTTLSTTAGHIKGGPGTDSGPAVADQLRVLQALLSLAARVHRCTHDQGAAGDTQGADIPAALLSAGILTALALPRCATEASGQAAADAVQGSLSALATLASPSAFSSCNALSATVLLPLSMLPAVVTAWQAQAGAEVGDRCEMRASLFTVASASAAGGAGSEQVAAPRAWLSLLTSAVAKAQQCLQLPALTGSNHWRTETAGCSAHAAEVLVVLHAFCSALHPQMQDTAGEPVRQLLWSQRCTLAEARRATKHMLSGCATSSEPGKERPLPEELMQFAATVLGNVLCSEAALLSDGATEHSAADAETETAHLFQVLPLPPLHCMLRTPVNDHVNARARRAGVLHPSAESPR